MKSDKLQDAVGLVRDDFVKDAEYRAQRQAKVYPWVKWVAAAACLGVAVLIAVPALKGQTPEVEPEPVEPTAIVAPIVEPEAEPVEEPTAETTPSEDQTAGWAAGGIWTESHDYTSYDEFAKDVYDPVFEAFATTEEAQMHDWRYQVYSSPNYVKGEDGEYYEDGQLVQILFSWDNSLEVVYASDVKSLTVRSYNYEPLWAQGFDQADKQGNDSDYEVDGVSVQKMFVNDFGGTYKERVSINGLYYYVEGTDEAEVDAIATALARIAATL